MKYPEWAPSILVKRHKNGGSKRLPPAELDTLAEKCHVDVTDIESIHYYERYYRRFILGINSKQINTLLGKFLTDIRMKNVWKSLTRRADKELDFYFFFASCEDGITGWQDDLKHSTAEQKAFYQEIHDTVHKLIYLMDKSGKFSLYSRNPLIDYKRINELLRSLEIPDDRNIYTVTKIFPKLHDVLINISEKATQYGEEKPTVKKPKSENADIHYLY